MLDFLKNILPKPLNIDLNRQLQNNYFKKEINFSEYQRNGYTVIKDAITTQQVDFLTNTYLTLTEFPEYNIADKFQNSGRYTSPEIRNFVMSKIGAFSKEVLPELFNAEKFDENTTGAFQIKPPSKVSELNPHQDAPVIDELKQNGMFVWIPLCDITEINGAIYILPGSHLWGNHQRSLNVQWPLEKHSKTLWKNMTPVYMKKGDILCWDTALIHASSPNFSTETRVALTTTLLPKNFKMVEYFKDKNTPTDSVEKFQVERSFWEAEDIMKRPPIPPNQYLGLEKLAFPATISKRQLLDLIDETKIELTK